MMILNTNVQIEKSKEPKLRDIFERAKHAQKEHYGIYSYYANLIFDLGLGYPAGELALQKLAHILKV